MFSLIYGFIQHMCKQDEFHVLIVGLDKAGKTNVLEKLKTLLSDLNGEHVSTAHGKCHISTIWQYRQLHIRASPDGRWNL